MWYCVQLSDNSSYCYSFYFKTFQSAASISVKLQEGKDGGIIGIQTMLTLVLNVQLKMNEFGEKGQFEYKQ